MNSENIEEKKRSRYESAKNFSTNRIVPCVKSVGKSMYNAGVGLLFMPYSVRKFANKNTYIDNVLNDESERGNARRIGAIIGTISMLGIGVYAGKTAVDMRFDDWHSRPLPLEMIVAPNLVSLGYEAGRKIAKLKKQTESKSF